jgi:hypothetical protein
MTHHLNSVNLSAHDAVYDALVSAHDGKTEDESRLLNAKIILALANEVGDPERVIALLASLCSTDAKQQRHQQQD